MEFREFQARAAMVLPEIKLISVVGGRVFALVERAAPQDQKISTVISSFDSQYREAANG